jgi:predicted Zn-dependent peptidase
MSGRLFETIREKRHLVYGVSFGSTQRSSGMIEWSVSLGLDKNKIKTARRLVEKELVRPATKAELKFAIEKTIGTFALAYDANGSIGDLIGSSLRVGIDWQEAYYNYEHNIIKAGKQLNDYIKILNFKDNILVGLIGKK